MPKPTSCRKKRESDSIGEHSWTDASRKRFVDGQRQLPGADRDALGTVLRGDRARVEGGKIKINHSRRYRGAIINQRKRMGNRNRVYVMRARTCARFSRTINNARTFNTARDPVSGLGCAPPPSPNAVFLFPFGHGPGLRRVLYTRRRS